MFGVIGNVIGKHGNMIMQFLLLLFLVGSCFFRHIA